jgi:hypothetical protein
MLRFKLALLALRTPAPRELDLVHKRVVYELMST